MTNRNLVHLGFGRKSPINTKLCQSAILLIVELTEIYYENKQENDEHLVDNFTETGATFKRHRQSKFVTRFMHSFIQSLQQSSRTTQQNTPEFQIKICMQNKKITSALE